MRNKLVFEVFIRKKSVDFCEKVLNLGYLEAELYWYLDGDFIDRKVVLVRLVRVIVRRVALRCVVCFKIEDHSLYRCENQLFHVVFKETSSSLRGIRQ